MSYSGSPGRGNVEPEVVLHDSHDRSIDASFMVNGIGDPSDPGGCVPPPGMETCN
jgi:hypothetical protein